MVALVLACTISAAEPLSRYRASEPHMGTVVTITLYASSPDQAQRGFVAAFRRIAQLDAILSDYNPQSELSRACASDAPVSRELRTVLIHAQELARKTEGAFDITAGALTRLWRACRAEKRLPRDAELREALQKSGYARLEVTDRVRCSAAGMLLDAGGIAKGYAADEALRVLSSIEIRSALVAVSGDIAAGDSPPGEKGWRVRVLDQVHMLANSAVSTSGDEFQFVEIEGVRYSHILDPRTGMPLRDSQPVSAFARTGMEADALATALAVQSVNRPQARR